MSLVHIRPLKSAFNLFCYFQSTSSKQQSFAFLIYNMFGIHIFTTLSDRRRGQVWEHLVFSHPNCPPESRDHLRQGMTDSKAKEMHDADVSMGTDSHDGQWCSQAGIKMGGIKMYLIYSGNNPQNLVYILKSQCK